MLENSAGLTVLCGSMEEADQQQRVRQGFWLRMAREAAGLNQAGAAKAVGLGSKSAISDYESGATQVPQDKLRRLASLYGWALAIFTEPDPTAAEQAQERMARLARAAMRLADRESAAEAEAGTHADDGSPGVGPHRRLA